MAIDLLTYEFLKRYVEGSQMGQYAKPKGIWKRYDVKENNEQVEIIYSTGDYVTYNNTVYIVPFALDATIQTFSGEENPEPGTDETKWQEIAGVNLINQKSIEDSNGQIRIHLSYKLDSDGISKFFKDNEVWRLRSSHKYIITVEEIGEDGKVTFRSVTLSFSGRSFAFCSDNTIRVANSSVWFDEMPAPPSEWEEVSGGSGNIHNLLDGQGLQSLNQILDPNNMRFKDTKDSPRYDFIDSYLASENKEWPQLNDEDLWSWENGAVGDYAIALNGKTRAEGSRSTSAGSNNLSYGANSFTTGNFNLAFGESSVAEGSNTTAIGRGAHAEGIGTVAGDYNKPFEDENAPLASHAEGYNSIASGYGAHAEGGNNIASGAYSHAGGFGNIANKEYQTIIGKAAKNLTTDKYAFAIGNGTINQDYTINDANRSNAMTVDWNGNMELAGGIILKDTVTNNKYKLTIANGELQIDEYKV